jgi:hypothetical protein
MNDDDLTSSNWLRPAFEAIAEKAQKDGKPFPAGQLENFIGDRKHAGSARRLAYEWLVKADSTAPDRLLPQMLDDPSPELRRDALAVAIQAADELAKKKDKGAKAAYRKALKTACDEDQVTAITTALEKLGDKVDLAKHYGFVMTWHLIGPFEHHKGVGWDTAYPPEKKVDLASSYKGKDNECAKWIERTTTDPQGKVDLNKELGKKKGAVAYAYAVVESPKERPVELRLGSITGAKIWLNGKEVFNREEYHHGTRIDQYFARGKLKAGKNTILMKVCQNEQTEQWAQSWGFQLRLCDFTGSAVVFTQAPKEGK